MTKIPIITQNFSSPDVFSDTPLMLLPQASLPPLPDKDQEGFSQLLLHDLHRHRQSYVRSYTAFETLKKRQDFILRQENLRSLQNLEQRISTKQDQYVDQSFHSYEQCFVKVINGNIPEQHKRPKTIAPSFDKFHIHQLSHTSASPLDASSIIPFHRYQKSHRPPLPSKYRSNASIHRSAQSLHDAFHSTSFLNHSQPFLSFTEGYLQKYSDRQSNKFPLTTNHDGMGEIREEGQIRSSSAEPPHAINQNKQQEQKPKTPDSQHMRATASSRNTNTPSSTPQFSYHDALRDGLTMAKDDEYHSHKMSIINEKRRSSQQSSSQGSNSKASTKRPKTGKKKQAVVVDLTSDKKTEPLTTISKDDDLLKKAMIVQNYGNPTSNQNLSSKIERSQLSTSTTGSQVPKPSSTLSRSSIRSNDENTGVKKFLDNIDTQMTTTTTIERAKQLTDNDNRDKILAPITNSTQEGQLNTNDQLIQQQESGLELVDNRKRIRKGAFDTSESMNDMVAFELGIMSVNRGRMKKTRFRLNGKENTQNEDGTEPIPENQATLDLLEKIRQSASGVSIGQPPLSQQGCRFELPFDLKLLETLTPLDYLSKYCRLSSRRNYQFKRIFDKYRNSQYRFESTNLHASIIDVHTESFTRTQYDDLCQLIDLGNEQHQFTFDTFSGILALCERVLHDSTVFRSGFDEHDLAKDTIEKCDFDSLDRKLDGLIISDRMKRLLKKL